LISHGQIPSVKFCKLIWTIVLRPALFACHHTWYIQGITACISPTTRVKTHELWQTLLFQQADIKLSSHCLFQTCWQVVTHLQRTCYKFVDSDKLLTGCEWQAWSNLSKQHCYNLFTGLLQPCCEIFTCVLDKIRPSSDRITNSYFVVLGTSTNPYGRTAVWMWPMWQEVCAVGKHEETQENALGCKAISLRSLSENFQPTRPA
jgi:hypothetical protein